MGIDSLMSLTVTNGETFWYVTGYHHRMFSIPGNNCFYAKIKFLHLGTKTIKNTVLKPTLVD